MLIGVGTELALIWLVILVIILFHIKNDGGVWDNIIELTLS